jgi:hypothetical protein
MPSGPAWRTRSLHFGEVPSPLGFGVLARPQLASFEAEDQAHHALAEMVDEDPERSRILALVYFDEMTALRSNPVRL